MSITIVDKLDVGLEAISMQAKDGEFIKALRTAFEALRKNRKVTKEDFRKSDVAKVAKKYTGLTIQLDAPDMVNAYVYIPNVDANNPMITPFQGELIGVGATKKAIKDKGFFAGGINLDKHMVYGDIANIKHTIAIGSPLLSKGSEYTVDEAMAIFLHEVGHLFAYYEFMFRLSRTNAIMVDATERLMGTHDPVQRQVIVRKLEGEYNVSFGNEELLVNAKSPEDVQVIAMETLSNKRRDQLGWDRYAVRSMEAMADQFPARLGLEAATVTGVAKLIRKYDYTATSTIMYLILETLRLMQQSVVAPMLIVFLFFASVGEDVYDRPRTRLDVIRKRLVARIGKTRDADAKKALLIELEAVDAASKGISDRKQLLEYVAKVLIPYARRGWRKIDVQKALEELAVSELHVSKAKLQQLL